MSSYRETGLARPLASAGGRGFISRLPVGGDRAGSPVVTRANLRALHNTSTKWRSRSKLRQKGYYAHCTQRTVRRAASSSLGRLRECPERLTRAHSFPQRASLRGKRSSRVQAGGG
jgi:hypothetical protein